MAGFDPAFLEGQAKLMRVAKTVAPVNAYRIVLSPVLGVKVMEDEHGNAVIAFRNHDGLRALDLEVKGALKDWKADIAVDLCGTPYDDAHKPGTPGLLS